MFAYYFCPICVDATFRRHYAAAMICSSLSLAFKCYLYSYLSLSLIHSFSLSFSLALWQRTVNVKIKILKVAGNRQRTRAAARQFVLAPLATA